MLRISRTWKILNMKRKMNKLVYHPLHNHVTAFSTTRAAGGNGVHPWRHAENRLPIVSELGIQDTQMVVPHQTHTTNILQVDEAFMQLPAEEQWKLLNEKDAVITNLPEVCVCVSTADCIPVFLYDEVRHAIAAIHAGWRGTCAGIVTKTCLLMQKVYGTESAHLHAFIGPGISLDSFEVGDEVYEAFQKEGHDMSLIARRYPAKDVLEKWHIDLWECNRQQLLNCGVPASQIGVTDVCTVKNSETFYSARKLGVQSGRILNGIMIRS